jgi:hypothetical protein
LRARAVLAPAASEQKRERRRWLLEAELVTP